MLKNIEIEELFLVGLSSKDADMSEIIKTWRLSGHVIGLHHLSKKTIAIYASMDRLIRHKLSKKCHLTSLSSLDTELQDMLKIDTLRKYDYVSHLCGRIENATF